ENMHVLVYRGMLYTILGQYEKALADIDRAIEVNPVYALAYIGRASGLNLQGQSVQAVKDYTKAIELCDGVAFFYNLRADAYAEMKNFDAALADHARAIELSPDQNQYRRDRAFLLEKMGAYELALDHYSEQIAANPEGYLPYIGRAAFYERTQHFDEALKDYSLSIGKGHAAGIEPIKLKLVYLDRADIHLELGEIEKALQDATTAIELTDGKDAFAFTRRGQIYDRAKQYELALGNYDRAAVLNPDDGYVHYYRAHTLHNLKRYDDALEEYSLVIDNEMMPEGFHWLPLRWRAEIFVEQGKYGKAVQDLDEVLIRHPTKQDVIDRRKVIADFPGIKDTEVPEMLLQ
ncbi:MAG: tetratricopeptide repeat protein, partial [Verrucomicrobia bacterium]|nr:tetratricopeptide repeat protein [Verrucomicrobiota bacterium]